MTTPTAREVWRDYVTDGVPASLFHEPEKREIRLWGEQLEQTVGQVSLGFATLALLNVDLTHDANTLAMVYADATPANNGIYQKAGLSGTGSWSRVLDLPYPVVQMTVTGGTGNAIVATAAETPTTPGRKLFLLTPTANNTGAATLALNGGSAVAIKNAFGATLASGSLIAGNQAMLLWQTDHYQLLVSAAVDGNAILADAQAAATAAAASQTAAAGSASSAAASAAAAASVIGLFIPPQGRLTLTSGVPDMLTSVATSGSVYYGLPGQIVPLWDGTKMVPTPLTAILQCLLSDATKSPAAAAANKVYSFFIWPDGSTIRLTRSAAWTNNTTRGFSLTQVNGISLNAAAITNGPAAQRGTWIGDGFTDATGGTISFVYGGLGTGGVAGNFGLWNAFNRVQVGCKVIDNGASYQYSLAAWRQARGSAGMQVKFMTGLQEDIVQGRYRDFVTNAANAAAQPQTSLGFNTTSSPSSEVDFGFGSGTSKLHLSQGQWLAPVGVNILSANQQGDLNGNFANTFNVSGTSNTFGLDFNYWY